MKEYISKQWPVWFFAMAVTLNIIFSVEAGIRMVNDPQPKQYNRMRVKTLDDGQVAYLYYNPLQPYKVGDIFTFVGRDDDGTVITYGPKVMVLELVYVGIDDVDQAPKSYLEEKPRPLRDSTRASDKRLHKH